LFNHHGLSYAIYMNLSYAFQKCNM